MAGKRLSTLFSALLIPAGLAFVVTAFAYGFMAFGEVHGSAIEAASRANHPLFQWLRAHGTAALIGELIVLAALTAGVMATERK